jgi:hypothetical protein
MLIWRPEGSILSGLNSVFWLDKMLPSGRQMSMTDVYTLRSMR